ncbi:hypothetical protein BCP78_0139 [Bacillus phage BCP78]|uniref:Uncharacterized protein n=2 Tax=Tsarbombavirus BCP78 TaxID=1985182 RepID=J9PRY9_9CAUD|nr:hypothetical protein BCP78_0139 [Bacillus phage BCP78]YP_009783502.1 hypothetical protein QLX27_gp129 [Bacillus phage BCU4]AEW47146.1 hypothetical protein BCP78_0139 [Bacillus phage BCP78]AEW47635.1 hypothetical protein BCU4_0129 [Bacillus phage BCU4]
MSVFMICTLLYLAAGVYFSKKVMNAVDEQLHLYNEGRYKEIEDDDWEDVKDMVKMKEQMGDKAFNYIMYPLIVLFSPILMLFYFIKESIKKVKDYWTKGRFQKIKDGTKVVILEKGRYEDTDHFFKEGYVEGFLPAHMTPHKQDIYMIGFEGDDLDTRYAYEPDKFKIIS